MEEFREMKGLRVVNLRDFHEKTRKGKLGERNHNCTKSRLKIRTDSTLLMKTEGSDKSIEKLQFLKAYHQSQTPTKLHDKLKSGTNGSLGNKE
jgi:hypothetical protein